MLNNSSTDFSKVTLTVRLNVPSAWKTWQTLLLYRMVTLSTEKIYQTQSGSEDGNVQSLVNVLNRCNSFPISPCEVLSMNTPSSPKNNSQKTNIFRVSSITLNCTWLGISNFERRSTWRNV
jgi:hypothetical protein